MQRRHLALAWLALAMAGNPIPPASARTMQQKLEAACAEDVRTLCPEVAADPDAVKACLLGKRGAVSHDCLRLVDAAE